MDEELPPLPMPLTPDEEESALLLLIHRNLLMAAAVDTLLPLKKSARKRRVWTWPYLQRRTQFGHYDTLMEELYSENPDLYKNFTRMDRDTFNSIVEAVSPPPPPAVQVAMAGWGWPCLGRCWRWWMGVGTAAVPWLLP